MKIHWHIQREHRVPFGPCAPDPAWFEPIGFPPPWPDRPWVYAETDVMVDESRHAGVITMFQFEQEGAELLAEGSIGRASRWRFRRWRFNHR